LIDLLAIFKTRGERRATKGDKKRRPSRTIMKGLQKKAEVRRLTSFERHIYVRETLVLKSLIILWQ